MAVTITGAVLTSMASGMLGALLTVIVYGHREKRRLKVDTLKRFAANRYDLKGDEFSRALNEIFVVFNDVPDVMRVLKELHEKIVTGQGGQPADDALIRLYKAMCKDTKIKFAQFNDSFFMTPFNPKATRKLLPPDSAS